MNFYYTSEPSDVTVSKNGKSWITIRINSESMKDHPMNEGVLCYPDAKQAYNRLKRLRSQGFVVPSDILNQLNAEATGQTPFDLDKYNSGMYDCLYRGKPIEILFPNGKSKEPPYAITTNSGLNKRIDDKSLLTLRMKKPTLGDKLTIIVERIPDTDEIIVSKFTNCRQEVVKEAVNLSATKGHIILEIIEREY